MVSPIESLSQDLGFPLWLLLVVVVWSLTWKALALWKSARLNHKIWFVTFFIVHTIGILEMIYFFIFSKIKFTEKKKKTKR